MIPIYVSIAQTLSDLKKYDDAVTYFMKELDCRHAEHKQVVKKSLCHLFIGLFTSIFCDIGFIIIASICRLCIRVLLVICGCKIYHHLPCNIECFMASNDNKIIKVIDRVDTYLEKLESWGI